MDFIARDARQSIEFRDEEEELECLLQSLTLTETANTT